MIDMTITSLGSLGKGERFLFVKTTASQRLWRVTRRGRVISIESASPTGRKIRRVCPQSAQVYRVD